MIKNERDFKGIWIPKEIWLSEELTLQEKVFLVEINSLDNEKGCFASNDYFANFFGISKTRASIVINSLVKKGYVRSTIKYKDGSKQILNRVLNISYIGYETKVKDPMKEKFKDNNTISNTVNNTNNKENIDLFFNSIWELYPNKQGKSSVSKTTRSKLLKIGYDKIKLAIERYIKYVEHQRQTGFKDLKYLNGSTFFNGRYEDYLDENYKADTEIAENNFIGNFDDYENQIHFG